MGEQWFVATNQINDDGLKVFLDAIREAARGWGSAGITPADTQAWVYTAKDYEWMILTLDVVSDGVVTATLRLDVDHKGIRGGWSPSAFNWDEGVPANDAGVATNSPNGIDLKASGSVAELAGPATLWIEHLCVPENRER